MPEFFSSDGPLPLQFLVIFGVIVVLLMAAYLLFRRIAGRGLSLSARPGNRARQPRLGIVDIYELDRQRQLILLRRDNVEHLLLVGGPNDVVVERNVQRGAGSRLPAETVMRPDPAPDMPEIAASKPPFAAPSFEMPVVVPPPLPGSNHVPDPRAPRLDPALFEPEASQPEPSEANDAATARGRTSRFLRRTPPPLINPRPDVASERPQADEPKSEPVAIAAVPEPEASPPVIIAPEPRNVDPAVLSDMARQLEVALRRPSSAVTPPPGQAPRSAPEPARAPPVAQAPPAQPIPPPPEPAPAAPAEPDPIAARMAASLAPTSPVPQDGPETPAPPSANPAPEPEPALPEPPPPAPVPPTPAPQARKPEPQQSPNPFSVEEIEAEFARLLGRPLDNKKG